MQKQRILIVGGGFAGVRLARTLGRDKLMDVSLMSDTTSLYYYPALYRSVTGYSTKESDIPLTDIFENFRGSVRIIKDRAVSFDGAAHTVIGKSGTVYEYDKVVFAVGAITSYFGISGIEQFSFEMKTPEKAKQLRNHLHKVLLDGRDSERDFVVIGAGPTGVELSAGLVGYLDEIKHQHNLKRHATRVHVVEAAPVVLPRLKKHSQRLVRKRLRKLGVHLLLNTKVESENADGLVMNGKIMESRVVIWTSGVANNPFFTQPGNKEQLSFDPRGRVVVNEHMQATKDVYVIGDNAAMPYAGLAQTAINDAKYLSKYLSKLRRDKAVKQYKQKSPITVIPVGPRWAITEWGDVSFGGWRGAFLRSVADLIGYIDILPFRRAVKIWASSSERENECKYCKQHSNIE